MRVTEAGLLKPVWAIADFRDRRGEVHRLGRLGVSLAELMRDFERDFVRRNLYPGNCLLNEGINELWSLVAGTGGVLFDDGHAYIGAGDSATAAIASQTGLQAPTNKFYKAMDASYPTYGTSQKATWRSTFGTGDGNFDWNEITVANGSSDSAKNLNRKVQNMGTKTSAVSRIATLDITLT